MKYKMGILLFFMALGCTKKAKIPKAEVAVPVGAIASTTLTDKTLFEASALEETKDQRGISVWKVEVRAVRQGTVISKTTIDLLTSTINGPAEYDKENTFKLLNDGGLAPGIQVWGLEQSLEFCDGAAGETLVIWDGKELAAGPAVEVTNSSDYAVSNSYKYIWKHGCLQVQYISTPNEGETDMKEKV